MGVPFDNVTCAEAITLIDQMIISRRPHYLVTPNVDFLVQATKDVELRRILFQAHLAVCDGTPLLWASRLLGNPLPERVAGADLVPALIELASQKGYRLFFLGASPESVSKAVERLRAQYPELHIAGYYSPPYAALLEMDHAQIKRRIFDAQPDLLFVAFGCPKQEKWIAMHYRDLGVPVAAGVGGTIDFLGGTLRRAPVWMQKSGTEWIFRLLQEPRRLAGRYGRDLCAFGWHILPQWWRMKALPGSELRHCSKGSRPPNAVPDTTQSSRLAPPLLATEEGQCIHLPERLDLVAARQCGAWTTRIREERRHWLVDLSGVKFIDSTGVGLLIQWKKLAQTKSCEIVLLSASSAVQQALSLLRLEEFFLSAKDPTQAAQLIETKIREQNVQLSPPSGFGLITVAWYGDITAANTDKVWKQTEALLRRTGSSTGWVIDLSHVTFLDSSGIGVMVRLRKWARQAERDLSFTGLQPVVRNVLRLAHLEEFLLDESKSA